MPAIAKSAVEERGTEAAEKLSAADRAFLSSSARESFWEKIIILK